MRPRRSGSSAHELGWSVNPLAPSVGAQVDGANFNRPFNPEEGNALEALLLEYLVLVLPGQHLEPDRHVALAELVTRVGWTDGQLTIWDNRAVLHYAMNDYSGHRRSLQRVTVMEILPNSNESD